MNSPFFLCTGFHRSGTSLVAQSMNNAGINMGNELMGASFSNPLGHVEDMPIVRLHDKIFAINGTDWRYHDNGPLIKPNWLSNYIARYISEQTHETKLCGVKDPRAPFFLNDWHMAGKTNLRYVFVYRHWSTSANSILNRASRHLVNNTYPVNANKINISFWQQPNLAFDMWIAANLRILDFYKQFKDRCILISQEAFVGGTQDFTSLAKKIDLPEDSLSNDVFDAGLMTNKVDDVTMDMVSGSKQDELNQIWSQLESESDAPALITPSISKSGWYPDSRILRVKTTNEEPVFEADNSLDVTSLTWPEALGFLVRVNQQHQHIRYFISLLNRPFTSSENYQTLARIAHKCEYYIVTKLSKMRAMQIERGTWQVSSWSLFAEGYANWIDTPDDELPQIIPFSLRPSNELADYQPSTQINVISADWQALVGFLSELPKLQMTKWLTTVLLYRKISTSEHFSQLAALALKAQAGYLAEYCLIKSLRLGMNPITIMELGDIYRMQNMTVKALQCFEESVSIDSTLAPALARMSEASLTLGNLENAQKYLIKAAAIAPNNRIVKLCREKIKELKTEEEHDNEIDMLSIFTMNAESSYQDILSLTRSDKEAGELLDIHNRRMCFILRGNNRWLSTGMTGLRESAANCLSLKVYRQWQKLWSDKVLRLGLNLDISHDPIQEADFGSDKPAMSKVAFLVTVSDISLFELAIEFMISTGANADWLILCTEDKLLKVSDIVSQLDSSRVSVKSSEKQQLSLTDCLSELQIEEYDLVCKLNCSHKLSFGLALQQYYATCSDNMLLEKVIGSFNQQPELGLAIPQYHPEYAQKQAGRPAMEKITEQIEAIWPDELPGSMYIYPATSMFWFRPSALNINSEVEIAQIDLIEPLLPVLCKRNGLKTKCIQLL